ncbi:copper homeostasis protein CutC, partial [Singulisphaera rosea]
SAIAGIDLLTRLTRQARGRVVVMAGGAINEGDAATLVQAGIREIHIGSSVCDRGVTRAAKVRSAIEVVRSHD